MSEPWWRSGVVYQIYPRSFADADGDGIGDLAGLTAHLDHLSWLGVDGIWLSPVYPSPMADFGYDVSDHTAVDPVFGSLEDLDALVEAAHERHIRMILDWVPNHTSEQHDWFRSARRSRSDPQHDWYVWRDGTPDTPPNNWIRAWSERPAWTWDEALQQWYLHCFLPQQPDLNWANPDVETAMHGVLRFWLDRGIDGFRADVVHLIGKDPALGDDPSDLAAISHVPLNDRPETHELLRRLRSMLDGYAGDRMMVGEVYLLDVAQVASYYGHGDELHLSFNFVPLHTPWRAEAWTQVIDSVEVVHRARDAWPTWVLSNHDIPRQRTRMGGSEGRARAAAVALLTLRGTPFLYAGEELGLEDAVIPADRVVDPGGRDGCRAPIPWTAGPGHGWSTDPWLPFAPDAANRSVESQRNDESSILHLYRRLLATRKASPALRSGTLDRIDVPAGAMAWSRTAGSDRRVVAVNMTTEPIDVDLAGTIEVSSADHERAGTFSGRLEADEAVVLLPPS
jgi:alpha-glucosidase